MSHSHSIYVFDSRIELMSMRSEIYERILQYLSEGNAVAYVGDEEEAEVLQQLGKNGTTAAEEYLDRGLLTLVKRDVFYSPFIPSRILLDQWNKLYSNMKKNVGGIALKGFVAIGMPAESFFLSDADRQQLVHYESMAAERYDGTLEAMCLYTTKMIEMMTLKHIISLLNAHQNTGHRGGKQREWNVQRGLEAIKRGLDATLGSNVSEMVIGILVRDFGGIERSLVLCSEEFERKLNILLGDSAAILAMDSIKTEIIKDVVF